MAAADPAHSILILGASTRAAAHSAIRAGLSPICGDLFADCDLRACARVLDVVDYPHGLIKAAVTAPADPWMYTGGLENHPRLVARISQSRPLWGNGADVLRRIRDPWHVEQLLQEAGFPTLRIWPPQYAPPFPDGRWVQKPRRGAAGRGICVWDGPGSRQGGLREPHYFQERKAGSPVSALFLAAPQGTVLLGMTRQLVGLAQVHAPPFAWCGTITPISLPDDTTTIIRKIGELLGDQFGLQGLFGCDFLVDQEQAWLTEVNPRYPASTELVEQALGVPLLDWHRRACESFLDAEHRFEMLPQWNRVAVSSDGATTKAGILGKIVLYAPNDLLAPDATRFIHQPEILRTARDEPRLPFVADIPNSGQPITRGQPICTLFARGETEAACLAKLIRRAAKFERRWMT